MTLILFVIMSLFGAQSIFAAAASTEEALQRAKELNSNRERLPVSDETKKSETKTSTSSGAESLSAEELMSTEEEKSQPGSESDPVAPTSSESQPVRGQTIVVDDATSLSTAAPLAESVPMTFETWKGLFLQNVEETDLLSGLESSGTTTNEAADNPLFPFRTVDSYLVELAQTFATPSLFPQTNFCNNWAAVKFPDAGQIRKGERPEGCWEQSGAWRAAKSFQAAALLKKGELTGLFENIRNCVPAYVGRLSTISEPVFSDEFNELLTEAAVVGSLFKSARDLLAGIVFDLQKFHGANLRKLYGDKHQCSDPGALVRQWDSTKIQGTSFPPTRGQLSPTGPRHILTELSKCANDFEYLSRTIEGSVLHDSSHIWSFCSEDMENLSLKRNVQSILLEWDFHFLRRMASIAASLWEFEGFASCIIQTVLRDRDEAERRFPGDICGRIRHAGARYQDLVREFRQVFSHDEELLLRTKNAFESDLLLGRTSLARTWRKICETHKFPPVARVPGQRDVACMMFSGDFPEAESARGLDASAAAEEFRSVLDDVVPRVTALRGRFKELICSEGTSSGAHSSSNELDLEVLEREALLVATQLRKLECLSDSMDALWLNIVVTAPNGEVICERDATLYASSGSKLTIGALTNTIRDDIEVSVKKFLSIRDADPVKLGLQNVQRAMRGASLSFDSTYFGPSEVGRAGLIKLGFLGKMSNKDFITSAPLAPPRYENVVFSDDVMSDIGPGKLSLVCQMEQRSGTADEVNGIRITVVASIVFFSEKDGQFYQLPLKCDNISRSSEQNDTLFHTILASSSLIGGEGGSVLGGGVTQTNDTVLPSALSSDVGIRSGFFSRGVPKGSRTFGGFFEKSSVTAPTRFRFSDEGSCAAAYSAIEAFHGKGDEPIQRSRATRSNDCGGYHSRLPHYLLEQVVVCPPDSDCVCDSPSPTNNDSGVIDNGDSGADDTQVDHDKNCKSDSAVDQPPAPKAKELQQRWDYPLIAAITRGRVTEAVIHHEMETSAELPKIGEFLKSFTTDTIDLQRIKIVPYGADDLFDDETAVLDVLRQQDRNDMEWEVRGVIFLSLLPRL